MSETYPPEGEQGPGQQPPSTGEMPKPPKPKLHWGFAVLGFVVAGVASWGMGAAATALLGYTSWSVGLVGPIAIILEFALFAGMVIAAVEGRRNGNNSLRSFGIGGLVAYMATVLVSLLAVGACFVSIAGSGLGGK